MKRPLWSILTAAVAAVLPGMTGPSAVDAVSAPVAEAKPAPEAVQVRRPEIPHDERQQDDLDENPAPVVAALELVETPNAIPATVVAISAPPAAPEVAPRARRALGRPRVRAPDHHTV